MKGLTHMSLYVLTTPQGLIRSSIGAVQRSTTRSKSRGCMWQSTKISLALVICLPPQQFLHQFLVFRLDLSVDPQLKITERWRGLQKIQLLRNKKIMQDVIWHKQQFLTILLMRRWWSVGSNAKLEHIQYLCLYVSSSSDLATLQGSPQKAHGHWNTTRQRQWVEGISGHPAITTI